MTGRPPSFPEDDVLRDYTEKILSLAQISQKYGCSLSAINAIRKRHGVEAREPWHRGRSGPYLGRKRQPLEYPRPTEKWKKLLPVPDKCQARWKHLCTGALGLECEHFHEHASRKHACVRCIRGFVCGNANKEVERIEYLLAHGLMIDTEGLDLEVRAWLDLRPYLDLDAA